MNNYNKIGFIAISLLCSTLYSCDSNDNYIDKAANGTSRNDICFGVASGSVSTKSDNGSGSVIGNLVLRSEDSADTLCVKTVVSKGISDNTQLTTKGTPITTVDDFNESFNVLAYWKQGDNLLNKFYMNDVASNISGSIWSTTNGIYYWPGTGNSLKFYAVAPTGAVTIPTSPTSNVLGYSVPSDVANQKDVIVAKTDYVAGNNNSAVPLSFEHICTAVRFVVGSQMQAGEIRSVSLEGVYNVGTYNVETGAWTPTTSSKSTFSQALSQSTTGKETDGTAITSTEGTFMMLPQTLPTGAKVSVVFYSNLTKTEKTLTASIAGAMWEKGTTVTYKLSISPEYELEFLTEPAAQDAHYVIYPINIKAKDLPTGGWTLTSNDTENVTFVETFKADGIKNLVDAGYWLKEYAGSSSLTSTTSGEDIKIYVFLKENVTESDRDIVLSLKPTNNSDAEPATFSFKQFCPAWNNGIGVERIEDGDYQWGFNWDENMKITYTMQDNAYIYYLLFKVYIRIMKSFYGQFNYVTSSYSRGIWTVTIDFSEVSGLTTATSLSDGLKNTWDICNFGGVSEATTIMNQLEAWNGSTNDTLPTNPDQFAAKACAMKNPYTVKVSTSGSDNIYSAQLSEEDLKWYLPAKEEAPNMNDDTMSGDYWTSTAITEPGTTSYKYTAGSSTSDEDRNTFLHVRAVRKK
jgi:hypothetical protein